jgi:uncharacterized integral membrane protein
VSQPEERAGTSPAEAQQGPVDPAGGLDAETNPVPGSAASPAPASAPHRPVAERTRTATAFSVAAAGAVVFLVLLIFILENTEQVKINFFGATGHISLGVALLLAAVGGALIVAILGGARIAQLRHRARRGPIR